MKTEAGDVATPSRLALAGTSGQLVLGSAFLAILGVNRNEVDVICFAILGAGLVGLVACLWRPLRMPLAVLNWLAVPLLAGVLLIGAKEWGGDTTNTLTVIAYGRPERTAPAGPLLCIAATLAAALMAAIGLTGRRGPSTPTEANGS